LEDLSKAIDMESLLREFLNVHFIKNFFFLGRVAKQWKTFQTLSRSQREISPLKADEDFSLLVSEGKGHTQTPMLSAQIKQFFASKDFQEFSQFAFTSYGSLTDSFAKFERLERVFQFPYINTDSFSRTDLPNAVNSLAIILPGNNFFWRVMVRFLLESSQEFFIKLQSMFLKDKNGFKDSLELFNKVIIRDFLERYLGDLTSPKDLNFRQAGDEHLSVFPSQHTESRSPLLCKL
jgi:hypothetical protein